MGFDGMCSMINFNVPKIKQMSVNSERNGWEAVYAITSNAPFMTEI